MADVYPDIYQIASDSAAVTALLGDPPRFYLFGHAKQNTVRPYATWQIVYGNPDNSLSCVPSEDMFGVQVDAWGGKVGGNPSDGASMARQVAVALRDAFEATYNHMVAHNGEDWEPATGLYRVSMTFEFWTQRNPTVPVVTTLALDGDESGNLLLSGEAQTSGSDILVI